MNPQTKVCQNCKQDFSIEPEDFVFYERIKVPAPTFCPECRQERRYAWRNERVLYRRNCDLCGKSTVTIYSPNKPFKIYCPPCWWGDEWDPFSYGREFDFSRPFFPQFQELQREVPRMALLTKNSVNSDYVNHGTNNKNCYLSFATLDSENIMHSTNAFSARDCVDCYWVEDRVELLYECISTYSSYQSQYSALLNGCANCFYCYDCRGCSDCFLSVNLRNKRYYILNKPYTKEAYKEELEKFKLGSFAERQKLYTQYRKLVEEKALHRFATMEQSVNSSGNLIFQSKNAHHAFDVYRMEDAKYAIVALDAKNVMDIYHMGQTCELVYEAQAVIRGYNVSFAHLCYDNANISYCDTCHNSQNLFGCVSVKKGTYAIFNKRYSEEEYNVLKEKIIEHMKETKEYGEFFPHGLSPFGYNETQAQVYMPLTKEKALERGLKWEDNVPGTFGKETMVAENIPDDIKDVADSILNEVLACVNCKRNYNIVRMELDFYRRGTIPIPRRCPNCRYAERISIRPVRKLWHRMCTCAGVKSDNGGYENTGIHSHAREHCPNEFETPYAPNRPETVYCEQCYNAEIA